MPVCEAINQIFDSPPHGSGSLSDSGAAVLVENLNLLLTAAASWYAAVYAQLCRLDLRNHTFALVRS